MDLRPNFFVTINLVSTLITMKFVPCTELTIVTLITVFTRFIHKIHKSIKSELMIFTGHNLDFLIGMITLTL